METGSSMSELGRDGFDFGHDVADQRRNVRIAHHLRERRMGQRADRIERDVAQKLHPDFAAEARGDRAAQAGADERLGNFAAALRARAVRLAQRDAVSFGMANDAGLDDFRREIDDRADHVLRLGWT